MTRTPYAVTPADTSPAPRSLRAEERYEGYRAADHARPYAAFFRPDLVPLSAEVTEALAAGRAPTRHHVDLADLARSLQQPGDRSLETGWTRSGGRTYVAVRTPMPGVTAAMWDWWFGWHGTETSRYKLWHPQAHRFTAVGDDRSADRGLTDRQRYVGNVSYVDELIGTSYQRLAIRFVDPVGLGFDDRPGWTHVCARVGFHDRPLAFGWLVHQVRPTEDGAEMRSRFVLNDPALLRLPRSAQGAAPGTGLLSGLARIGVSDLGPRVTAAAMPRTVGDDMVEHCAQEMSHLASFLPELHAAFAGTP